MNLVRYNPNRWFDFPFERVFDELWGRTGAEAPVLAEAWAPRVDIREEKDAVLLSAELPGVAKDDVKIELENGVLTVSGEKHAEQSENENGIYRSERVYGSFKRSFRVPETVDADKIAADYSDGVLKLTLPKRPEAAPRKIAISGEGKVKHIKAS
jgi:HSP20 family protein